MKLFLKCAVLFLSFPVVALAVSDSGLSHIANALMSPLSVATDFLHTACLLLGSAFIFASIVKYFEHRRNPLMTTLTTVIFSFMAGLMLLSLPLVIYIKVNGIPLFE